MASGAGPSGLAFDETGDLYVSNALSGDIRRFSPTGTDLGTFASGLNFPYMMEFATVPEPSTYMLATFSLTGCVILCRRGRSMVKKTAKSLCNMDAASEALSPPPDSLHPRTYWSSGKIRSAISLVAAIVWHALPQPVRAEVDILVYQSGASIRTGAFDFGSSTVLSNHRVFGSQLLSEPSFPGVTIASNPGWNAVENASFLPPGMDKLPGQVDVGFNVLSLPITGRNLSFWDGTGSVSFGAVPSGEVLKYTRSLSISVVIEGGANDVQGYTIARTNNGGYIHRHPDFELFGNSSLNTLDTDSPTPGVYLLAFEANVQGFAQTSDPFFVLLGNDVSFGQIEQAEAWTNAVLIPEPGASVLVCSSAAAAITYGIRRRKTYKHRNERHAS